jgi:hypothetical protein
MKTEGRNITKGNRGRKRNTKREDSKCVKTSKGNNSPTPIVKLNSRHSLLPGSRTRAQRNSLPGTELEREEKNNATPLLQLSFENGESSAQRSAVCCGVVVQWKAEK